MRTWVEAIDLILDGDRLLEIPASAVMQAQGVAIGTARGILRKLRHHLPSRAIRRLVTRLVAKLVSDCGSTPPDEGSQRPRIIAAMLFLIET